MTSKKADDKSSDTPFKCPDCPATFKLPTGLGIHRRMKHGIMGSAPSTLAARQKVEAGKAALKKLPAPVSLAASATKPTTKKVTKHGGESGKFQCPECPMSFTYARVLGKHRAAKHGVAGASKSALLKQRHNLERHTTNGHSTALETLPPPDPANHSANPHSAASLDPLAYAIAVGSVKEFCRNFAEEHGIVTKQFTRQFAELFLREARR